MKDERIERMKESSWPLVCAYVNRGEINIDGVDYKEDSVLLYIDTCYEDEEVEWFIDEDSSGKELMNMLHALDNGHAYNRVIIHDWEQIPEQHWEDFRKAIVDARIKVTEVLFPIPMED